MPLPIRDVVWILGDNLRLRGSVLPISARNATRWTRGLELSRGGETVLYTGQMYQLIPYIERLVAAQQRLGDSPVARFTGLGRRVNRLVNISAFIGRPSKRERADYDRVPRRVVRLLREAGIEFGCLYEDDLYSGALAHDLGLDELVQAHARRVHEALRKHGVKNVITVDPHTTNMLRTVYPTLLDEYDVTVRSYLEVLADQAKPAMAAPTRQIALHDSCVYARHEGVVAEPRKLLAGWARGARTPQRGTAHVVLRRTGGVAVSGQSARDGAKAGRTAARNLERVRHDVPPLPRQPDEGRGRDGHVPGHLRASDRGARAQLTRSGRGSVETAAPVQWCSRMWRRSPTSILPTGITITPPGYPVLKERNMPETATYRVPGMSCEHCERAVSEELTAIAGVDSVAIDLDSKIVQVTGASLHDEALRAAIVEAGYEPE